ncbi:MAG TPA: hypothetical protein VMV79_03710 [Alphaproteobacteria bacterium]|nr:hypothetical protein [Alphaproteobacteria bacterium]
MNEEFLKYLQGWAANVAISPSTVRGMGPKGTMKAAIDFLAVLDLSQFTKCNSHETFNELLNKMTKELQKKLPRDLPKGRGQYWGTARKCLNIFLRDAFYNHYLREKFCLSKLEPWLEVPLDSYVAKGLRAEKDGEDLPKWESVVRLEQAANANYQKFAEEDIKSDSIWKSRVHLDVRYWRRKNSNLSHKEQIK